MDFVYNNFTFLFTIRKVCFPVAVKCLNHLESILSFDSHEFLSNLSLILNCNERSNLNLPCR